MAVDKELLDILACPKCKGPLILTKDGAGLICEPCRLLYDIKDDIPIMLIDEAHPLPEDYKPAGSKGGRAAAGRKKPAPAKKAKKVPAGKPKAKKSAAKKPAAGKSAAKKGAAKKKKKD